MLNGIRTAGRRMRRFAQDESGAVTVDWVVMTAGICAMIMMLFSMLTESLYESAVDIVVREGRGSVSLLQRALGVGSGRDRFPVVRFPCSMCSPRPFGPGHPACGWRDYRSAASCHRARAP